MANSPEITTIDKEGLSPLRTLRADANFLRFYLENYTMNVPVIDGKGHIVNSFTAVKIPDWAVRQRLDDIDDAIRLLESEGKDG